MHDHQGYTALVLQRFTEVRRDGSNLMGWAARKLCGSDWEDPVQVVQEYFEHKEQKVLQEKQLAEFWKEYEDERGA